MVENCIAAIKQCLYPALLEMSNDGLVGITVEATSSVRAKGGTAMTELLRVDHRDDDPLEDANQEALKDHIDQAMAGLNHREREILRLRYGLQDGYAYTLEEVGNIFSVTRERVRQIESKAVRKLQQPYRSNVLRGFVDLPRTLGGNDAVESA